MCVFNFPKTVKGYLNLNIEINVSHFCLDLTEIKHKLNNIIQNAVPVTNMADSITIFCSLHSFFFVSVSKYRKKTPEKKKNIMTEKILGQSVYDNLRVFSKSLGAFITMYVSETE